MSAVGLTERWASLPMNGYVYFLPNREAIAPTIDDEKKNIVAPTGIRNNPITEPTMLPPAICPGNPLDSDPPTERMAVTNSRPMARKTMICPSVCQRTA